MAPAFVEFMTDEKTAGKIQLGAGITRQEGRMV
jgi:hypothetical protein